MIGTNRVASIDQVHELTGERIADMERLAIMFKNGLFEIAQQADLPLTINHVGSLLNLFFTESHSGIHHDRDALGIISRIHLACLCEGLFIAPREGYGRVNSA
ncbi:MAG: hypothetical protein GY763_13910 [Gammaproteobacteria bacterium]|nr:hypothetical protein [Gammaproteobacteria bacterium]